MQVQINSRQKNNKVRHQVQHEYHDHALDDDFLYKSKKPRKGPRGGVTTPFPVKLHNLLQENLYEDIISWQPHGRCFILRKPREFLATVMPKFFKQTKLTSFQRQLNLYGFNRLTSGPDKGGYYHELFLRGKSQLCAGMVRMRIKGTRTKGASNPDSEPNFYCMPPVNEIADDRVDVETSIPEVRKGPKNIVPKEEADDMPKFTYTKSPVCVSTPSSVRSDSPMPGVSLGLPHVPSMSTHIVTTTLHSRRPSMGFVRRNNSLFDLSLGENDLSDVHQDDSLMFEGKEFHYLEPGSFPLINDVSQSFYDYNSSSIFTSDGDETEIFGLTF